MILENINSPKDVKSLRINELKELSEEIRELIIDVVSKNGGHLSSNLGVVELTLALHYVFDFSRDKLIFDVSHQAYTHKIITGRKDSFQTLRTFEGISGYANPLESPYDAFIAGHASTSLALALGFVIARKLKNEDYDVVALIGDGALTGGEAYEGLNNLGHLGEKVIIVLNDNGMSISRNVGAISKYLARLRTSKSYVMLKKMLGKNFARKFKLALKELLLPNILFEEFGFTYIGPVEGHDLTELIDTFERVKNLNGPVVVHVVTKKGYGYKLSEEKPDKFHSAEPFDFENGKGVSKDHVTFSDVFGKTLVELAEKDKRIVAITAAMPDGTKTSYIRERFPERFIDVGIAEQCAVTTGASLAKEGFKPFVAIYSTFLQRALDQLIHDVSILSLPVVFAIDRAGIVSDDGPTHQGIFDIAYLSMIPNFVIAAPKDAFELKGLMSLALDSDVPFALRYPKDIAQDGFSKRFFLEIGKGEIIKSGTELTIVTLGPVFYEALKALEYFEKSGYSVGLINAIFAKPFDKELILKEALRSKRVLTVEDGIKRGGFGENLKAYLSDFGVEVTNIAIDDFMPEQGKREDLLKKYGISSENIVKVGVRLIEKKA
ncbi:1-deoxy-D-xylulose-5-phosphate synthase [Caldisericum exile]|uniref:1-deoxy-D-xylulose-5-phosphate synthase n=1 Tax=Caldisericum exile (strain DSM 21853 / NBRC 104410 / AZM16c01) TaxID=511051 RepID=A0A7U6JFW5_CALEA|nr:1-deoxy-D-xylulose-5-phosphate synthase [Caldisericum exile]BAL80914.1 1-deoxy-D-xylulose-5-phosphate synthase [Caldisericum exile AZM16c01]